MSLECLYVNHMKINSTQPSFTKMIDWSNMLYIGQNNSHWIMAILLLSSFHFSQMRKKIEIFLNYGIFKRYGTRRMVHSTRVKIMVRLHNYGTVRQRWNKNSFLCKHTEKKCGTSIYDSMTVTTLKP